MESFLPGLFFLSSIRSLVYQKRLHQLKVRRWSIASRPRLPQGPTRQPQVAGSRLCTNLSRSPRLPPVALFLSRKWAYKQGHQVILLATLSFSNFVHFTPPDFREEWIC